MTELIAIHTIMRKHPSGAGLQSIRAGETFVSDSEAEFAPLVKSGAARMAVNKAEAAPSPKTTDATSKKVGRRAKAVKSADPVAEPEPNAAQEQDAAQERADEAKADA